MHIGFLTPEYPTQEQPEGGLANYIKKTGYLLTERSHQVSVFVLSNKDKIWQDGPIEICESRRVKPPQWLLPKMLGLRQVSSLTTQYLSSRRLASKVLELHREHPIDILQVSSYKAPGYALLKNDYIPVICRISSYTPLLRSAFGRQRSFSEYLSDWMEVRQVLDSDGAFAPSELMANAFASIEGFSPDIIRTPFDLSKTIHDDEYYKKHLTGKKYLLFFGTLNRVKGADLLADVIPLLLNQRRNLYFVLVGRDDGLPNGQKVFELLRSRCESYRDRLFYFPPLPKSKLLPIIQNARAVLMPSRVDNYPNACLEAQLLGVPVVGTYDSSLDEMIVDGKTGFLATNDDPASIYKSIGRLLSLTGDQRKKMKKEILDAVRAIQDEDRIGQLINFYETVIEKFHD